MRTIINQNLDTIFTALAEQGVKNATVVYSGSDGEFSPEQITYYPNNDIARVKVPDVRSGVDGGSVVEHEWLADSVRYAAYAIMDAHNPGYHRNFGGGGTIIFDVDNSKVQHTYYANATPRTEATAEIDLKI